MKIPAYWCSVANFGDELNLELFKKFADIELVSANPYSADISGIGSLLDFFLSVTTNNIHISKPINIYSSGFGFEEGECFHIKNLKSPESFCRTVRCYALRGKLTQLRIKKMTGQGDDSILGDAGLLASLLIDKSQIKQEFDLGIVPHYADQKEPIFAQIQKDIPNSTILDITKPALEFLKDLCRCRVVVSTAMHPLIACDSLRIPNRWIRISEQTTTRYKFYDYYSVYDIKPEPFDLCNQRLTRAEVDTIKKEYSIPQQKVAEIQENLLHALQNLKNDLHKHYFKICLQHNFYIVKKMIMQIISRILPVKSWRKKMRCKYR